jgi:hypothetical protein
LLLSGGVGSYLTQGIHNPGLRSSGIVRLTVLLCALAIFGIMTPYAVSQLQEATTSIRILVAIAVIFPLGLFMGMAFPLGMKVASHKSASLTPWLWGINGATSVWASVLAVAIALSSSISISFWTGFFCYVVALLAFLRANRWHGASLSTNLTP